MAQDYKKSGSSFKGSSQGQSDQRRDYDRSSSAMRGGDTDRNRKKHSGASKGTDKNGKQYFRGWNFSQRRGMITVYVTAFKSTGEHSAANGNVYTNLMAKVEYKDSGVEKLCGALLSHSTGRVTIPELGMVLNPAAPNGGYFGKFSK